MVNSQARSGSPLGRSVSLIEAPNSSLRFLILDCPTESTLPFYMEEFKRYNVTDVVRCCQPTYPSATLTSNGINVHDMPYKDGGLPPINVVREWLGLLDLQEQKIKNNESSIPPTLGIHCISGLGRAPVLVAIALIELGMEPLDAIEFIRSKRRGAFNRPQICYLDSYKRMWKTKSSTPSLKFSLGKIFKFGSKKQQEVTTH